MQLSFKYVLRSFLIKSATRLWKGQLKIIWNMSRFFIKKCLYLDFKFFTRNFNVDRKQKLWRLLYVIKFDCDKLQLKKKLLQLKSVSEVNAIYRSEALTLTEKLLIKTQLLTIFYSLMKFWFISFILKIKNLNKN